MFPFRELFKLVYLVCAITIVGMITGCGQKIATIDIETSSLLPSDIALKYLNLNTPCRFFEYGMEGKSRNITPYKELTYTLWRNSDYWLLTVSPPRTLFSPSEERCDLVNEKLWTEAEDRKSDEEIYKLVTALESLGMKPTVDPY